MDRSFPPTRAEGLARLAAFAPRMGRDYAGRRNSDLGPDGGPTTAQISPYLRRRLVLEQEAVQMAAPLGARAEKFVSEVFWRTYWKGYLEQRPSIWSYYLQLVEEGERLLAEGQRVAVDYDRAVEGRTGIDCFDAWAREIVETNWLHNHARMWFASIWIFTLRLPWALGAQFFLDHLLDGDPASNTLSWRWVAGLHTSRKPYVAWAENIERFTCGRFNPVHELNETPEPLFEEEDWPLVPLRAADAMPQGRVALLLHEDDLVPETLGLDRSQVTRVGALMPHSPSRARPVRTHAEAAVRDGLARAAEWFGCPGTALDDDGDVPDWAGGETVVTAWAPLGPMATRLAPLDSVRIRRDWDSAAWPSCRGGFFGLRNRIPRLLTALLPQA